MEQLFQCPPSFDLDESLIYKNTSPEKIKSPKSQWDGLKVWELKKNEPTRYLSADGRVWKEFPFPFDICFEKVDDLHLHGRGHNHLHTEFSHDGCKIHIDYVNKWSSGPGSSQSDVKIYIDNKLYANAITGGNSFGMNWGKDWPPTAVKNDYLYRLPSRLYWNGDLRRKDFKSGEEDFPISLFTCIPKDRIIFTVYDFTLEGGFNKKNILEAIKLDEIDKMFLPAGEERFKWNFIEQVIETISGNILDDEALSRVIGSRIFYDSLGKGIFQKKRASAYFDSEQRKLDKIRSEFFKSYLVFKYLALTGLTTLVKESTYN